MEPSVVSWTELLDGDIEKSAKLVYFKRSAPTAEQLLKISARCLWSPIVWRDNKRGKNNFLWSDFCALDFENPEVTIAKIQRDFCDSWHIISTTRNHQKQKGALPPIDRFRLILKWQRRITCAYEYRKNMERLAEWYGSDKAACDAGRIFFPSKPYAWAFDADLELQPVKGFNKPPAKVVAARQKARLRLGILSPFSRKALLFPVKMGERNDTFFKVACELARAGIEITDTENRILSSPTFEGKDSDLSNRDIVDEIKRTIGSAYKSVWKE